MKNIRRINALPIVILAIMASALSAFALFYGYGSLTAYTTPCKVTAPDILGSERLTERVVLVVLHGLTAQASQRMETLNVLRSAGADYVLDLPQPTLCAPMLASILTGADPELSGVVLDDWQGRFDADTIISAAGRAGLVTGAIGGEDLGRLLGDIPGYRIYRPAADEAFDEDVVNDATGILRRAKPGLLVVELMEPEIAGRESGITGPGYLDACWQTDTRISRLVGAMDLSRDTLIVISLHGLTVKGGFGGAEDSVKRIPLVMAGKGILQARSGFARVTDLAPTIAALLGCPVPSLSMGSMISGALDLEPYARSEKAIRQAQVRAALLASYMRDGRRASDTEGYRVPPALQEAIKAHNTQGYDDAFRIAEDYDRNCLEGIRRVRMLTLLRGRARRSIPGGLFILVLALPLLAFWRNSSLGLGVFAGGIYSLTFTLGFFGGPPRYSPSFVLESGDRLTVIMKFSIVAAVAFAVSLAAALAAGRNVGLRGGHGRDRLSVLLAAWHIPLVYLGIRAIAFWVWYDLGWNGILPPMASLLRYFADLGQMIVIGAAGLLVVGIWMALSFGLSRFPFDRPKILPERRRSFVNFSRHTPFISGLL